MKTNWDDITFDYTIVLDFLWLMNDDDSDVTFKHFFLVSFFFVFCSAIVRKHTHKSIVIRFFGTHLFANGIPLHGKYFHDICLPFIHHFVQFFFHFGMECMKLHDLLQQTKPFQPQCLNGTHYILRSKNGYLEIRLDLFRMNWDIHGSRTHLRWNFDSYWILGMKVILTTQSVDPFLCYYVFQATWKRKMCAPKNEIPSNLIAVWTYVCQQLRVKCTSFKFTPENSHQSVVGFVAYWHIIIVSANGKPLIFATRFVGEEKKNGMWHRRIQGESFCIISPGSSLVSSNQIMVNEKKALIQTTVNKIANTVAKHINTQSRRGKRERKSWCVVVYALLCFIQMNIQRQ